MGGLSRRVRVKIRLDAEQGAVCTPPGSPQEPAQAAKPATAQKFEVVNMVSSDEEDDSDVEEVPQWKPLEPLPVPAGTLVWVRARVEQLSVGSASIHRAFYHMDL